MSLLLSQSDHVLERISARVTQHPAEQSILLTSLAGSFLAGLLPYALSLLVMGRFAPRVVAALAPLTPLTSHWRALLTRCGIDVCVLERGQR